MLSIGYSDFGSGDVDLALLYPSEDHRVVDVVDVGEYASGLFEFKFLMSLLS